MEGANNLSNAAEALHHQARSLIPLVPEVADIFGRPNRVLVAILRHDRDDEHWGNGDPKDRFLWIKARQKIKIQALLESYVSKYRDEDPDLVIDLQVNGATLPGETIMQDLDHFADQTVVLTAVDKSNFARHSAPAGEMAPLPHGHPLMASTSPARTPSRPPLQPINRQFTVPPQESLLSPRVSEESKHTWRNLGHHDFENTLRPLAPREPQIKPEQPSMLGDREPGYDMDDQPEPEEEDTQEYQPREYDNAFATEDPDTDRLNRRGQPLRQLAQDVTPERLEAGVRTGVDILSKIQVPLEKLTGNDDAIKWLEEIENVRKEAVKTRTVVGVVGNTGAGKSSVINAMLDEERLVPTNCMRACTAVVTELSWNDSKSENSRYRAEVEFIKPADWQKELEVLFQEVFDDEGHLVQDARNSDSQAGIALAKIRAVYPKYTQEMLSKASVNKLMNIKQVRTILGTTKSINERIPGNFYKRLQHFVDSKEKGEEKVDKNGNKMGFRKREFEYWPLIKVVKIYTKADALSTGAVIVDLPGVHDSNAARAAVAEGYMKQCTGLWIVAPINRAVDDKAAKSLLGDTFKRQLKYDGSYSAVTFICSKTDDISKTEAADSLKLGDEMERIEEGLKQLSKQRRDLSQQLNAAKAEKDDYVNAIDDVDGQLEKWDELNDQIDEGKTVYEPKSVASAKKRKRTSSSPQPRKRRRRSTDIDSDSEDYESAEDETVNVAQDSDIGIPLTKEQIEGKIDELKGIKREARKARTHVDDKIRELRTQVSALVNQEAELDSRGDELCIAGRSEYSRAAIRQDFAAGIKELDQENAEEEDPDNFNPDEDIRDYAEVARSLPVYCVSSRAYQKLSGRMQKDSDVPGFSAKEQTEVPQLQSHCKKLTERGRQANCRRFLNSLDRLLGSLGLWSSDDGTGIKLTDQQRDVERANIARRLKELEKALEKAVKENLEDITGTLTDQLFEKFGPAVDAAVKDATPVSQGWGAHRSEGGLHHSTYKATVRRSGVYQGASGHRDFNAQLTEPIYKHLASAWEKCFQRRLPHILHSFTKAGSDLLKKFHATIEKRCQEKGLGLARLATLSTQADAYKVIFNDMAASMIENVNEGQREINREFTPVVTAAMETAYQLCTDERGPGSFNRMRGHMSSQIHANKMSMFTEACDQVRRSLLSMCDGIRTQMLERADGLFVAMQRDYMSIVGGANVGPITIPREERSVRRELDEAISSFDGMFQNVVDSNPEDLVVDEGRRLANTSEEEVVDVEDDAEEEIEMESEQESDDGDEDEEDEEQDETGSKAESEAGAGSEYEDDEL